jgi:hypothetical protein
MIPKRIDLIQEEDLLFLIDSQVQESKTLEYKRELPDGSDRGKVSFLRAISAFANTIGGDLVYGIDAKDGIPSKLNPLVMTSIDQTLQWLEQLSISGLEPRLTGVQYKFVPLPVGGHALVIRVARSWNAPHRVTVGGHSHFYGRNSAGAYPLDVGELRQAFTMSETAIERISKFRADRIFSIAAEESAVVLSEGARVILHLVPLNSFSTRNQIEISAENDFVRAFCPPGSRGWNHRLNLDGRVCFTTQRNGRSDSYTQLYRDGRVEAAFCFVDRQGEKTIPSRWYEEQIIKSLRSYLSALSSLGVSPPIFVALSMLGVSGYSMYVPGGRSFMHDYSVDRDTLIFPELQIDEMSADPTKFMKSTFDSVWNAFGYERSLNYDENSNFRNDY